MERIKNYTSQLKSSDGLDKLEKEPAFVRRNIDINEEEPSKEENNSRYEVGDKKDGDDTTLRNTNSFLHDNVD